MNYLLSFYSKRIAIISLAGMCLLPAGASSAQDSIVLLRLVPYDLYGAYDSFVEMQNHCRNEYMFFTNRKTDCERQLDKEYVESAKWDDPEDRALYLSGSMKYFKLKYPLYTEDIPVLLKNRGKRKITDPAELSEFEAAIDDCENTYGHEEDRWNSNLCLKNKVVRPYLCPLRIGAGNCERTIINLATEEGDAAAELLERYKVLRQHCQDEFFLFGKYQRNCSRIIEKMYKRSKNTDELASELPELGQLPFWMELVPALSEYSKPYFTDWEDDQSPKHSAYLEAINGCDDAPPERTVHERNVCIYTATVTFIGEMP